MIPSKVGSVTVSAITPGTNSDIGAFYAAPDVPIRLTVLNVGGTEVQFAFDSSAVNGSQAAASTSDRFQLPAGREFTFLLAPKQMVFAIAVGGGRITFHANEALPLQDACSVRA